MRPTIEFISTSFDRFNRTIFKSRLPVPRFAVSNSRTRLGELRFRRTHQHGKISFSDFTLSISGKYDLDERQLEDTVIHEMIHLLIHSQGLNDTAPHGTLFRSVMQKINHEHNRHITVSQQLSRTERDSDTTRRHHYVCVLRCHDGRTGVTCVARTRIFELWDLFADSTLWHDSQWYLSTDPYFNRFKRVVTPRYYILDNTEQLNDALSKSRRLTKKGGKIMAVK